MFKNKKAMQNDFCAERFSSNNHSDIIQISKTCLYSGMMTSPFVILELDVRHP